MSRRLVTVSALLLVLLGVPRISDAGILDFIWEMSGPQMLGVGYGCYINVKTGVKECRYGTASLNKSEKLQRPSLKEPSPADNRYFLSLGGSVFTSTGMDSKTQGYDWGEVWMVALEPGVAIKGHQVGKWQLYHGTGISYDVLFGRDFGAFDKFAFTVTPIDAVWNNRVALSLKLRLYPNGTSDDEFKPGPAVSMNRPFEAVWGVGVSIIVRK